MKILLKITILTIGCSAMLAINPSFGADEAQKQAAGAVQFPAGSYKNPAVLDLKGVKDYSMLNRREMNTSENITTVTVFWVKDSP